MSTETVVIGNREQLDSLLSELVEHGIEPAIYATAGATVGLLAPYCEDGAWDAFGAHPYSTEFDPYGLARQQEIEMSSIDGDVTLEGYGITSEAVILAVAPAVEHPGLDGLIYPVTITHEDRP